MSDCIGDDEDGNASSLKFDSIPHSGVFIGNMRPLAYALYSLINLVIIGFFDSRHFAR